MLACRHSGFSVDTSVCIAAHDRAGLERLRKSGSELVYRCAKQQSEPGSGQRDKRSAKGKTGEELHLTPLELIDRIVAVVPPPRTHRHRYFGVLAPNSPHRAAAVALAQSTAAQPLEVRSEPASTGAGEGALGVSNPLPTLAAPAQSTQSASPKRPAHYLWAVLMARI